MEQKYNKTGLVAAGAILTFVFPLGGLICGGVLLNADGASDRDRRAARTIMSCSALFMLAAIISVTLVIHKLNSEVRPQQAAASVPAATVPSQACTTNE